METSKWRLAGKDTSCPMQCFLVFMSLIILEYGKVIMKHAIQICYEPFIFFRVKLLFQAKYLLRNLGPTVSEIEWRFSEHMQIVF